MKFIIIEDNYFTKMIIKLALEKMGHEVVGDAETVSQAIDVIKNRDFDVILLDLILSDGNGFQIIENTDFKNKKVVAITAVDQDAVDNRLKEKGVNLILKKPFSYDEFEKAIKDIL